VTNAEAITLSNKFFPEFSILLKGIQKHSGVLLLQLHYRPTLLYRICISNAKPWYTWQYGAVTRNTAVSMYFYHRYNPPMQEHS
jgi:hypothetical protein